MNPTIEREFFNTEWEPVENWRGATFVTFTAHTTSPEESDQLERECLKLAEAWSKKHRCSRVKVELRSSAESGDLYNDAVGVTVER